MINSSSSSRKQAKEKWRFSLSIDRFDNAEIGLRERARFLYFLCLSMIGFLTLLFIYARYLQTINPVYDGVYYPVLLPIIVILFVVFLSILFLGNGKYGIAVHLLLISTITAIWVAMWVDKGDVVSRLDTYAFILAVLTILPLLISNYKIIVWLYILVNIPLLVIYLMVFKDDLSLSTAAVLDFIADTTIALLFIGLVGYYIFRINKRSMEKAVSDFNERLESEKAMRQSEDRYRIITEAFPDVIMLSDLKGNIIFGNDALERITGISKKDYSNTDRKAHIHPDDLPMVTAVVKDLLAGEKTFTDIIENRFIDSWGKTHWLSGIISKITMNNQIVLQTISRDITEKKLIEEELENYKNHLELLVKVRTEELEAANEELKSTNEELYNQRKELEEALDHLKITQNKLIQSEKMASLGALAAGVAHEINNPLNFIKGGVVALENYFVENLNNAHFENVKPLINGMQVGVKRAAAIVTSLNHYSHPGDTEKTEVDLHTVIDNCLLMLNDLIEARIVIEKDFTDKPFFLLGNEGRLHQAFLNILQNSVQAIEKTGKISINTQIKKSKIIISISDTGYGISSAHLSKIKDPFFTTKEPGKGTGLGIPISINILHDFDGTLEFESQQGIGTKAIITLPIQIKK